MADIRSSVNTLSKMFRVGMGIAKDGYKSIPIVKRAQTTDEGLEVIRNCTVFAYADAVEAIRHLRQMEYNFRLMNKKKEAEEVGHILEHITGTHSNINQIADCLIEMGIK